jgi:hypothetical protein
MSRDAPSNDVSHLQILTEMREGLGRVDERLLTIEREIGDLKRSANAMDERQRQLVTDVEQAKGGIAMAKWLWLACIGAAGLVVAFWGRITG